jgi:HEAT repeat protein
MTKSNGKKYQRRYSRFWRRWLTRRLINKLQKGSVETRTYILQALGKIGDESAFPVITNAAGDANSTIRRFAISALADLGDSRAIDTLISALDDPEADIRAAAVMGLSFFETKKLKQKNVVDTKKLKQKNVVDERVENALIGLLSDEDSSVRTQAIISLGHLGSIRALHKLKQIMNNESNEWMRRYISQSIREIEGGFVS